MTALSHYYPKSRPHVNCLMNGHASSLPRVAGGRV